MIITLNSKESLFINLFMEKYRQDFSIIANAFATRYSFIRPITYSGKCITCKVINFFK